jgi:adenylate cyclase
VAEPIRVYRVARPDPGDAAAESLAKSPAKSPAKSLAKSPAKTQGETLALPDKPSIAVLPFANLSGDPEQEYFSDGITEDIITELSRFSSLFVIARNSTFSYKGQSVEVRQIARELGVRYVLEGSVRRSGKRLRITAQLIDSQTGSHIWAERYDRELLEVFDLQEEITRSVVSSIAPQIEIAEIERARRLQSENFTAYELALKAKALLFDGTRMANHAVLEQAVETAQHALDLDPRNVQALWTQGFSYHLLYTCRAGPAPDEALDRAWRIVERLSEIDSSNPYACMIRGSICWDRGEHDEALAHFRRAYALNPNFAWNLVSMAWCESLAGLTAVAKEHAELGIRLSPRDMDFWLGVAYLALALASFAEGDFETAKEMGKLSIEMHAKAPIRRCIVIASHSHLGDADAAARHLSALDSFSPDYLPRVRSGEITLYTKPEHNALLVEGIEAAARSREQASQQADR